LHAPFYDFGFCKPSPRSGSRKIFITLHDLSHRVGNSRDAGHILHLKTRQRHNHVIAGDTLDRRKQGIKRALADLRRDLRAKTAGSRASCTMTQRPVFSTDRRIVSKSSGFNVAASITSISMPLVREAPPPS